MEICSADKCTGCMTCMNACPQDAISVSTNVYGFYVPQIDKSKCVSCGICKKLCPANQTTYGTLGKPLVYAGWNKNEEDRFASTSGGVFSLLAEEVLKKNGIVFGAVFDSEEQVVKHVYADSNEMLTKMRGSKYVQSKIGFSYKAVREALEENHYVLFSGTPCQIRGLKNYLRSDYEKLLLCDIVCHGTPSPLVFSRYLDEISKLLGSPVEDVFFRYKEPNWQFWSICSHAINGNTHTDSMHHDSYIRLFLRNYSLNSVCYNCPYAGKKREGDITMGDFWGYLSPSSLYKNDYKGISLVLINTVKGKDWMDRLKGNFMYTEKSLQEAIMGNAPLRVPSPQPSDIDRSFFWEAFLQGKKLEDCIPVSNRKIQYPSRIFKIRLWLDNHYYWMPDSLKKIYSEIRELRAKKQSKGNEK